MPPAQQDALARASAGLTEPPVPADILRIVLDSTADGIVVADEQGHFLLFNPAAEEMIGIGLTECPPAEWSQRYGCFRPDGVTPLPPDELPLVRAIRGEDVRNFELLIRNPSRPEGVWICCNARPLRDGGGRLKGGVVAFMDITARKVAEREVQKLNSELLQRAIEQETRYRLAAKATRDAIYDWDVTSGRIEWNEGIEILFGHPRDEISSGFDWWAEHIHPDDRTRLVASVDAAIAGQATTWSGEYRFRCRDGAYALVVDRGHIVRDRDGRPIRMVGAMFDLTEHKRSEEALAHSLSLLEATLDSTADGILVVDDEGRIVSFNRKFVEMWRIPQEVIVARDDNAALGYAIGLLKDPTGFLGKVRELYSQPEAVSLDMLELKDGRVFERYSQARQLGLTRIGRVWSFRDVTQRHRAEQLLQEEREFLKTLLENCADGIIACDADARITLMNRAMRELYNLPPEFLPADDWMQTFPFYHADGRTRMSLEEIPLLRALRGEHVRNAELITIGEDGVQKKLMVNGNAILSPDGTITGAVLVIHDVTEHDQLQRQLLQSQKLESIGTLAGGIAHDFNNLLAVIMGNASVLLRDKSLPARTRNLLTDMIDAAERGSSLTHQLLAYARGGLQRLAPTDLNATAQSVLQMLRRTAPPQIEFVVDLATDLPAILADPSQIEQVVMNLCLNAVQATEPPGRVEVRTRVDAMDAENAAALQLATRRYARLEVKDYGSGMSAATVERIFEPFFTTKFTGRGMGLAATLGIVGSHHGQIRVDSKLGEGTMMTVWLPLAEEGSRVRTRHTGPRRGQVPGGTETILIVDDDPAVSRMVSQILSSLGYVVVTYNDVDSAMGFLETNAEDVNLVLLDLNIPKISGEQLFAQVRALCRGTPIILASGVDEPQLQQSARSWNAAGFLQKPFSLGALAATVRRALDGHQAPAVR